MRKPLPSTSSARLLRLLGQMRAIPQAQVKAIAGVLKPGAQKMATKIKARAARRTGAMAKGVRARPEKQSDSRARTLEGRQLATLRVVGGLGWKVTAPFPALFVEKGTKASPKGTFRDAKGKQRKNRRAHAATPAQPFFFTTIQVEEPPLVASIRQASVKGVKSAIRSVK